jgi:Tfp pilus assembly protein PilP
MKKPISKARTTALIAALYSSLLSVAVYAVETDTCQTSCSADLTECRKQVEKTTSTESHPLFVDSSTRTRYANTQASPLIDPKELSNPQAEEVQKRRMERNHLCATENNDCLKRCSPAKNPSKNSVIFKK